MVVVVVVVVVVAAVKMLRRLFSHLGKQLEDADRRWLVCDRQGLVREWEWECDGARIRSGWSRGVGTWKGRPERQSPHVDMANREKA